MKLKSIIVLLFVTPVLFAQSAKDSIILIQGFAIAAPRNHEVNQFIDFIKKELVPRKINTLMVRVDYNFNYLSHPELRDSAVLSQEDVKSIVKTCRENNINIIPQVNLLGHQSWHSKPSALLVKYPQFDETPHVQLPAEYKWPNADGLYCKSYCPLHPDVHKVVFEVMDEICDAFESTAFHAGMDEVFYIGDDKCSRCAGKDKAELFAGEVNLIREHLKQKKRELWIWGDRLIDGKSTGMGMWEASMNNTHRSIDMISKEGVICDWHYERPDQSPVLFDSKGFKVITCPWNKPQIAMQQVDDMSRWRNTATKEMKPRYYGMMQTVWTGFGNFQIEMADLGKGSPISDPRGRTSSADCFVQMFKKISEIEKLD